MIRHRPAGRGHAYRPSLDQRVPVTPVAGQPTQIRALVDDQVRDVWLDVRLDATTRSLPATALHSDEPDEDDTDGDGGHLAAAAAAGEHAEGMRAVAATLDPQPAGTQVAYRWRTKEETTDWHQFTVAGWHTDQQAVRVTAPPVVADRLDRAATQVLVDDAGAVRVRFTLTLEPDEHVLGLGERFHALDHRGHAIDTVVFEQYKQQGERTYLPVPFALIVGGASEDPAWGLHVDTTRRCWFDIAATTPNRLIVEVAVTPDDPQVDLQLFTGGPADVIRGFLDATARPAPVPEWVFRPWASANEWNTQARVQAEIARSLDERIPVGVVVIEAWSDEATFTAFRDAQYTPHHRRGAAAAGRLHLPRRRGVARSRRHDRLAARTRGEGAAVADPRPAHRRPRRPPRRRPTRPRPPHPHRSRLRRTGGRRHSLHQPRLVVPRRPAARLH